MANKKNKLAKPKPGQPTQRFLDIAEIKEDVVVLKDGTLRAVVMVSSINFALKSPEEQQAVIQSYMQFLNGIDYPLQIVIQSRKMNIERYMDALGEQEKTIENQLLKRQIVDYRRFIGDLVDLGEIMEKRFYIVVPLDPSVEKEKNFFGKLSEAISPASVVKLSRKNFEDRRDQLRQRVSILMSGLTSMSLSGVQLNTQQLIELYYTVYNPEVFDTQRLKDVRDLRIEEGF